jgi:hypothetical protein
VVSGAKIVGWFALGLSLAAVPTRASAQENEPRLTVAVGAGAARPLARNAGLTGPTWSITLQARATKHLLIGAMGSWWQHGLAQYSFGDVNTVDGPATLTLGRRISMRSFGMSALATAPFHRVRLSSGATVGYTGIAQRATYTLTPCGSNDPQECKSNSDSGAGGLAVQGLLGADVRLTPRLEMFVVYTLTLPATPGFATVSLMAGLRVRLR